jgi:hypothetical protein
VADAVRYVSQDGRTITRAFKITVAGQTEIVAADDLTHGKAWPKYAMAAGFTGRPISDVLVNIVTDQACRIPDVIGYPYFADGRLCLPATEYLPEGYRNGEGSTLAALTALVSAVAPYRVAALLMGLSASAPLVGALQLQPFTVHIVGDSTTGKTTAVTAAGALWGQSYKGVTKIWHGTALGALGAFRDLGVLPVFRDELGTLKATPGDRATMFSTIMEGAYRSARTRDDLARPSASWASVCFSTGNISAVPPSVASAGTPKGVIEIHADGRTPVIPADMKGRIQALTNVPEVAGSWVPYAKGLSVDAWRTAVDLAGKTFGEPGADGLEWHMWRAMSLALAGARALAELTGVPELAANAELAARDVIAATEDRLAEIGADHGARLVETVAEMVDAHPAAFGLDPELSPRIEQTGFLATTQDGAELTCVYRNRHADVARRAEVEDVTAALRQLRESGQIVTSTGQGLKYRARHAGRLVSVIAYNLSVESGQNTKNTQNSAGQGPNFCSDQGADRSEQRSEHGAETGSEQDSGQCPGCGTLPPLHASDCPNLPPLPPEPGPELDEYEDQEHEAETAPEPVPEIPAGSPFTGAVRAYLADCASSPVPLDRRYHPTADGALKSIVHRGRTEADAIRAAFASLTGPATETTVATVAAPELAAPELADLAPADAPGPVAEPAESRSELTGDGPAEPARRKVADLSSADELATFTRALRKGEQYPDATDADLSAALGIFREVTDGGRFVSFAGQTGQALFARLLARFPSMVPPEPVTSDEAREVWASGVQTRANYVTKGHKFRAGQHFTGYDANGQFPAAAGSAELGDGQPVTVDRPRSLDALVNLPGYVRVAKAVRTGHPAFGTVAAGAWLPMPFVKYLTADLGVTVPAAEVLYWPKHGRRLAAYVKHAYRVPRDRLTEMPDSPAVTYAMAALKDQANAFIGMLRSETYSKGGFYRPDWYDMIVSTAEANALRAFAKCDVQPVAKMADCAYWIADSAPYVPSGLIISSQLGKWKLERSGPVTAGLADAYRAGQAKSVHEAAKAADAERRAA